MERSLRSVVFLLVLVGCVFCQRTWFVSPNGTNGTCSQELPCAIWVACENVESHDTIQLLDGEYNLGGNACIIGAVGVTVVGSLVPDAVSVTCNDACFVLEYLPFSLSDMSIFNSGSANDLAMVYGENVQYPNQNYTTAFAVVLSGLNVQLTRNNLFYIRMDGGQGTLGYSMDVSLREVSVSGSCSANSFVGCVSAYYGQLSATWTVSSCEFTSLTTTGGFPLFDIEAHGSAESLSVQNLLVQDSTVYAIVDIDQTPCTLDRILIENVDNYLDGNRATALITVRGPAVDLTEAVFANITNDLSGLIFLGSKGSSVDRLNITNCASGVDQLPGVWLSCYSEPCQHTMSEVVISNSTYDVLTYFLYDYYSNTTLELDTWEFNNAVSRSSQLVNIARPIVTIKDMTVTGGEHLWGIIGVSDPGDLVVNNVAMNNVVSQYALISLYTPDLTRNANMTFNGINVTDSIVDRSVFVFTPEDSIWDIVISDSTFSTDASNTTAIVTCSGDGNGGADVVVVSSTCDLGNQCVATDEGYVSNGVCNFEVDDDAVCNECSSSSGGGGDDDDNDGWKWFLVALGSVLVVIILLGLIVAVVIGVIVVAKKQKAHSSYEAI